GTGNANPLGGPRPMVRSNGDRPVLPDLKRSDSSGPSPTISGYDTAIYIPVRARHRIISLREGRSPSSTDGRVLRVGREWELQAWPWSVAMGRTIGDNGVAPRRGPGR